MRESEFLRFLENDENQLTKKGIQTRISKVKKAEIILGKDLDIIVISDALMIEALNELQVFENRNHNPMQNAVRKYYKFVNNKEFPRKKDYE